MVERVARLGYGGDGEVTTVSFGPNSDAKYITTYFRRAFEISDTNSFRSLKLRLVRDDGAVVYLNGVEVFRSNMPTGAIGFTTNATAAFSGGDEFIAVETNLPPTLLRNGPTLWRWRCTNRRRQFGSWFRSRTGRRIHRFPQSLKLAAVEPRTIHRHLAATLCRPCPPIDAALPETNQWRTVTNPLSISGTNNRVLRRQQQSVLPPENCAGGCLDALEQIDVRLPGLVCLHQR